MPILKTTSGHDRSLAHVRRHLEGGDGDLVLAKDFINLCDRDDRGFDWAAQMDELREVCGNNTKTYNGRPTLTYKHYSLYIDPRDDVALPQLRELTVAWAERWFVDYQVAIIYHDGNASCAIHSHIVVNNTSFEDGHRLSSDLSKKRVFQMNNALQEMALERGLRAFSNNHMSLTKKEMADLGRDVSTLGFEPDGEGGR